MPGSVPEAFWRRNRCDFSLSRGLISDLANVCASGARVETLRIRGESEPAEAPSVQHESFQA